MGGSNSLPLKPEPGIRPYLWSLDMLTVVQESRFDRTISDLQIQHGGAAMLEVNLQHLRDDFRWMLKDKFGVEIHPDDIVMYQEDDFTSFLGVHYTARWKPSTHNVQFRAGSGEGWIGVVPDLGVSCQIPVSQHQKAFPDSQDPFVPVAVVEYRMGGWNEMERCWVFTPAGALF